MADADEEQWGDAVGGEAPRPGSRASRSLGLLCARFLELYSATHICGESHLSLDHAATSLGVERRRMYDVVGILEACEVVVRRGKNSYTWYGLTRLPLALDKLRRQTAARDESGAHADGEAGGGDDSGDDEAGGGEAGSGRCESRKDKSLGLLSQRFLQLFLAATSSVLSLEEAAQLLLGAEAGDAAKLKTKVRRLYDIANVLVSLQLIEKVHVDSRKPAFRWLGASGGGADPIATPFEEAPPPLAAPAKRPAAPSQAVQRKQPRRERAAPGSFTALLTSEEAPAAAQARRRRTAAAPAAGEPAAQAAAGAPDGRTAPHAAYFYQSQALHDTFSLYGQTVASIVGAAAAEQRT